MKNVGLIGLGNAGGPFGQRLLANFDPGKLWTESGKVDIKGSVYHS